MLAAALAGLRRPEELAPSYGRDVAASLASGEAGLAVAIDALERAGIVPDSEGRASTLLESAADAMAREEMVPDFFGGFTGIAWAAARVWIGNAEPDEDDVLSDVDRDIVILLDARGRAGPYDLVSGLVGLGVYALERLPRAAAKALLGRVIDVLEERAEARDGGLAWGTAPEDMSPLQRERSPSGHYDLGVAHGVSGIIGFLAQAVAAGIASEKARALLDGAIVWLRRHRAPTAPRYPYWIGLDGERRLSRSAWCYGDPGIAAVLLMAARCAGERNLEREALDLAREAAARPVEESGVVDACLCHGAAGLAHLFNRAYQRTEDEDLGRAATEWFERSLAMRRQGAGYGGYVTALKAADGMLSYEADASLLSGTAGVAMAYAAAVSSEEPEWDRMLLLSSRFEP